MINWHDTTGTLEGDCPWHDDRVFAELVARRLDIPFHVVDLSEEYRRRVVDYMFAEYERGRTPNPDVLCNREIKFDVFLKEALRLGADFVATGHYCRRECVAAAEGTASTTACWRASTATRIRAISSASCRRSSCRGRFSPSGGLPSPRSAAHRRRAAPGYGQAQGFAGHLLRRQGRPAGFSATEARGQTGQRPRDPGRLAEIRPHCGSRRPSGIGRAVALHRARRQEDRRSRTGPVQTIGQRKGLGIGGRRESLFVLATDVGQNADLLGEGDAHPGLYRKALFMKAGDLHWHRPRRADAGGAAAAFPSAYPLPPAVAGRRTRRVRRGRVSAFRRAPAGRHARPVRRLVRRGDAGRIRE